MNPDPDPVALIAKAVAALAEALGSLEPDSTLSHTYRDSLSGIRRAQGELAVWVEVHR